MTDSFDFEDPDAPDRTDGSTTFDYLDFHGWYVDLSDEAPRQGFATYGARTMPDNLPIMGSAIYEGYIGAQRWNADDPSYRSSQQWLIGDLTLEADLGGSTISGRVDGLHIPSWAAASGSNEPLDGNSIDIASTAIDQAGFNADWTGNGPMDAAARETLHGFTGTILGEFYGPAAEEVGGVLSGRRDAMGTAPEQILLGGFGASQPEPGQ